MSHEEVFNFCIYPIDSLFKEAPIDDEPKRVPTYTLTVNSGEGGTVDSTGGTYNQGQTVSVSHP